MDVRRAASRTVCRHRIGGGTERCNGQDETTEADAFSIASAISSSLARAKPGIGSSVVMALLISSCTSSPNVKGSSWSGSDSKRTERHPSAWRHTNPSGSRSRRWSVVVDCIRARAAAIAGWFAVTKPSWAVCVRFSVPVSPAQLTLTNMLKLARILWARQQTIRLAEGVLRDAIALAHDLIGGPQRAWRQNAALWHCVLGVTEPGHFAFRRE